MKVIELLDAKCLSVGLTDREFKIYRYLRQYEEERILLERMKRKFNTKPLPKSVNVD